MLGFSSQGKNLEELEKALQSAETERDEALLKLRAFETVKSEADDNFIFHALVGASTDAILVTNTEGGIVYVNDAWEKLTGYKLDAVLGKNPRILRSHRTPPVVYKKMWETLYAGESFTSEEIVNRKKDGTEYETHFSAFPIRADNKVLYYGSIHQDIASRKESDRVRGEFVSLVSHQLNTPLSVINWYAQMLISGRIGDLNHKQIQYAREIELSVKRVINLVNALLNVSRIEMGTYSILPEPISLTGIAEGVISELASKIQEKNILLQKNYESAPETINADPKITWMVFQNLLSNAVKYTPAGGRVMLSIIVEGEDATIKVTDTGYGIPQKDQPKIFEKMFRADNVKTKDIEGNGLGLYIVKSTLEAAGGRISFKSPVEACERPNGIKEECGTEFYVTIPLSGMKAKTGAKAIEATAEL